MNKLTFLPALLATALLGSCKATGGIPDSSIYLLDRNTSEIISTAGTTGELMLSVGEVFRFKVERLQHSSDDTQTSDVTTVSTYWFTPEGVATANSLGELRAVAPGTTRLEVRFRPDPLDAADRVFLEVTVLP